MNALSHFELFRATVEHRPHRPFLFSASYTPDLGRRLCERLGVKKAGEANARLGAVEGGWVARPRREGWKKPEVAHYYQDVAIPEGVQADDFGVLHLPGGFFHFNKIISPLRNARTLNEVEGFPFPGPDDFSNEGLAGRVAALHQEGKAVSA